MPGAGMCPAIHFSAECLKKRIRKTILCKVVSGTNNRLRELSSEQLAAVMAFRWSICTMLHILCPAISAFGLRHVWRESLAKERPCRISDAFP